MTISETTTKPTIFLIHGAWHSSVHFESLTNALQAKGYPVVAPTLPSVQDDGGPTHYVTLQEDAEAVRKELTPLLDEGKLVVAAAHSYGGHVLSESVRDLGYEQRKARGLPGGVIRLFYICAFLLPEKTAVVTPLNWAAATFAKNSVDGRSYATDDLPVSLFYSDLPESEREQWKKYLRVHSLTSFISPSTYAGWRHIPTTYLYGEEDLLISPELQKSMLDHAGVDIQVEKCLSGHSPFLTQPEFTADAISRSARIEAM